MKNKIAQFLMLVGLTVGLAAFAQAQNVSTYNVDIPFDFNVGEKSFTAGKYSIQFGNFQSSRNNFIIRSADNKQSAIITALVPKYGNEYIKNGNLVFNMSDEQYYLSEINTRRASIEIYNEPAKKKAKKSVKKVEVALGK